MNLDTSMWGRVALTAACCLVAVGASPGGASAQTADQTAQTARTPAGAAPPTAAEPDGTTSTSGARAPSAQSNAIGAPADSAAPQPRAADQAPRAAPNPTASAIGSGDGFVFRVCNRSSQSARAAATHREGSGWMVEGWWRVDPGQCSTIGRFQHGWVYYYADGDNDGSWGTGLVKLCARYPGPFQRYDGGGSYTCGNGERLKGFSGNFVEGNIGTYTWNLDD